MRLAIPQEGLTALRRGNPAADCTCWKKSSGWIVVKSGIAQPATDFCPLVTFKKKKLSLAEACPGILS